MQNIIFLTRSEVVDIHTDQIARYGGSDGIRDIKLLSSHMDHNPMVIRVI